jgi:hypothetical protein
MNDYQRRFYNLKEAIVYTPLKVIGMVLFFALALGIVGHFDYEEELRQEKLYCENVRNGTWGAYKPEINCNEVKI